MFIYHTVVNTFGLLWPMHANMWLQYLGDSTYALNVSVHIMREVLFYHLIRVNCTLYIALDQISQISDILIYTASIVKNIVCMIKQALTAFSKPVNYGEQDMLWILLHKVTYWI